MSIPAYRKPQFWLGILVSLACLSAIFFVIEPASVAETLRHTNLGDLAIGVLAILLYMWLRAVRWAYMLENKITVGRVFHLQNIGYMLSQILPLRIGDPARAVLVGSEPKLTIGRGLSTMVVERLLDLLAVVVLLPLTLSRVSVLPEIIRDGARLSGVLAVGAIAIVIAAANMRPLAQQILTAIFDRLPLDTERWVGRLDDLLAGLVTLTNWRSGATLIILSVLPWIPILYAYQMIMRAVGLSPDYLQAGFVACAGALSIAAPSSPGQVGVFHAGVTIGIVALGMESAGGAAFGFLYHTSNFILLVSLGILGLSQTGATFGKIIEQTRQLAGRRSAESD